jgi:hypothetical protein
MRRSWHGASAVRSSSGFLPDDHTVTSVRALIVAAVLVGVTGCQTADEPARKAPPSASSDSGSDATPQFLATLTPYPGPKPDSSVEKPPAGFEPVFAENVARHGSRSLTSDDAIKDAISLWDDAKAEGALTKTGRAFGPSARRLRDAMEIVGFGDLSTLGEEEQRGLGKREGERLSTVFDHAAENGRKVDVLDSGVDRTEASAESFSEGLLETHPGLEIEPAQSNEKLLGFDSEDHAYSRFLEDGDWKDSYRKVEKEVGIDRVSAKALRHLYSADFVASIDNQFAAATAVFDVYRAGPAMSRDVDVDTSRFMTPDVAETFAYLDDGRFFYSRGPGVKGDDRSYAAASVLLDDFFTVIDDHLAGRGGHVHAAVYRFTHGEEIVPFATLLRLPGADHPADPGTVYTHQNNDFTIASVSPLSANIEWTVWTKGKVTLVSMNVDEETIPFHDGCRPYGSTALYFELSELKRCLPATS